MNPTEPETDPAEDKPVETDLATDAASDATADSETSGGGLDPLAATDLQDHLLVASNDLDRLQRLLNDASDTLLGHFYGATGHLERALRSLSHLPDNDHRHIHQAMEHLATAITGMQFHDMATQLLTHTTRRLRGCADRLAYAAMGDDEDGAAVVEEIPSKPNPVTQDEMDAGSIELF
jgi:hypothetical protein